MERSVARAFSLPRFAMRREEAAASLSISPSLFDRWIEQGVMPAGRKIGGVVLWDTEEVWRAWCTVRDNFVQAPPTAPAQEGREIVL